MRDSFHLTARRLLHWRGHDWELRDSRRTNSTAAYIQPQRHGSVVYQLHLHRLSKATGLDRHADLSHCVAEQFVVRAGLLRFGGLGEPGPIAFVHVGRQRELTHDQASTTNLKHASVHGGSVGKHAQLGDLSRQRVEIVMGVIVLHANKDEQSPCDSADHFFANMNFRLTDALEQCFHGGETTRVRGTWPIQDEATRRQTATDLRRRTLAVPNAARNLSMPRSPGPTSPAFDAALAREEIQRREEEQLAPWAMRAADSRGRVHDEPAHAYRTAFMRDRDRIIHASAFRKLEYKTQVFVNHEGDYYRTRLTHTMEVAQIARTAARTLRLNEDLTESIALSHDLGHGPFGHKGEYVLRDLMQDHGGFEHNAHGLRVVDLLERRYPGWPGINLTYEVREAFALHSPAPADRLGFVAGRRPTLEAQLVDVCDSLAYLAHDLDDGVASGVVTTLQLCDVDIWREHWQHTVRDEPGLSNKLKALVTVKKIIDAGVSDLVAASWARIQSSGAASPEEVQAHEGLLIGFSKEMHRKQRRLSHYLHEHFYCHPRLMKMGGKARRILEEIFRAYRDDPRMLEIDEREWAETVGLERALCDKIAGMTDREAQDEYERLFSPFERL